MKNKLLINLAIVLCLSTNLIAQNTLNDGLVAHLNFDGSALDISGNGQNGTVNGATLISDRFGRANHAYDFQVVNSARIEFLNSFDLPQRSINIWFYARSIGTTRGVIYNSDNPSIQNGLTAINVVEENGNKVINFANGSTSVTVPILENSWFMATFVKGASFTYYYLNGVLIDSANNSVVNSQDGSVGARIGCSRKIDRFFEGVLDDLRIYDRALNSTEVFELYNLAPSSFESGIEKKISIYPIPSEGVININLGFEIVESPIMAIYDSKGQKLNEVEIRKSEFSYDISRLEAGVYFMT